MLHMEEWESPSHLVKLRLLKVHMIKVKNTFPTMVKIKWKTYKIKFNNKYSLHIRTVLYVRRKTIFVPYIFKSNITLNKIELDESHVAVWSSYRGVRPLGGSR
jgi:hypothetical protein